MRKLLSTSIICAFLLAGCSGGSDDPFVKEMTDRMADSMDGFDKSTIQLCIEEQSIGLSDNDKDVILATLNNPDGDQDFSNMEEMQTAMNATVSFSNELFSCVMSNK